MQLLFTHLLSRIGYDHSMDPGRNIAKAVLDKATKFHAHCQDLSTLVELTVTPQIHVVQGTTFVRSLVSDCSLAS